MFFDQKRSEREVFVVRESPSQRSSVADQRNEFRAAMSPVQSRNAHFEASELSFRTSPLRRLVAFGFIRSKRRAHDERQPGHAQSCPVHRQSVEEPGTFFHR